MPLVEYFGYHVHMALLRTAPASAQSLDKCVKQLTLRELTILNWVKNGKTNWEIATIMGITERTIRFHVESIFTKLGVTSRSQAVATAWSSERRIKSCRTTHQPLPRRPGISRLDSQAIDSTARFNHMRTDTCLPPPPVPYVEALNNVRTPLVDFSAFC
ncbi:MAG: helix-turn-helix transcriptional regulator [Nitrospira sp.]|nr:helix-turn-helix transcriptional regulator [Nitrospira sp.]